MKKISILIVEDDPNSASYLYNQLITLGYKRVDFAVNAKDAIELVTEKTPDLIFLDIFLRGGINGIEAAREILKIAQVPIIFVTASINFYQVTDAGFTAQPHFLAKPFTLSDVRSSISHLNGSALSGTDEYKEAERLKALEAYYPINTPKEKSFDTIARTAAKIFKVSTAVVTLVDRDKIWFKAKYGFSKRYIPKKPELFANSFLPKQFHDSNENSKECLLNPLFAEENGFEFFACAPLITDDGHSLGTLCVMDKYPRKVSDEEREILTNLASLVMFEMEMRRQTTHTMKRQRDFVSTAIHDLKNPLTSVLGFSEILARQLKNKQQEYNGYIKRSASNMLEIVNNLLDTTLLELEEIKLKRIPVALGEIVESAVDLNTAQAFKKKQHISVTIEGEPIVDVDPLQIGEALDNLISNAIKYSPAESKIVVSASRKGNAAIFTITDPGPGIAAEKIDSIFAKFSGKDASPTAGEGSTGFSLAFSKKMVELHGGKIAAESAGLGKGSTFKVELPAISLEALDEYEQRHEAALLK